MEALVAFGLAANIVQFVDFGFELFSQANEIKRSGSVSQHVDLDRVTRSLDLVSHKVKEGLREHDESLCLTPLDQACSYKSRPSMTNS
jgi:hypothetical protein